MINPQPVWQTTLQYPFDSWGRAMLLPDKVLGTWYYLERDTGKLLWQTELGRPNQIVAIQDDVIVATETRWDSPAIMDLGVFGISLESGQLLWISHASGKWGRFVRWLDYLPNFTNEFRDTPSFARPGEVVTERHRILDIRTGEQIGIYDPKQQTPREEMNFVRGCDKAGQFTVERELDCGEWGVLRKGTPAKPAVEEPWLSPQAFPMFCEANGEVRWSYDPPQQEAGGTWTHRWFLLPPYIYWVVAEEVNANPEDPFHAPEKLYALHVLDIRSGIIAQRVPLNEEPGSECRLNDIDESHLLITYHVSRDKKYVKIVLLLERLPV